jgi:hypothetical protein
MFRRYVSKIQVLESWHAQTGHVGIRPNARVVFIFRYRSLLSFSYRFGGLCRLPFSGSNEMPGVINIPCNCYHCSFSLRIFQADTTLQICDRTTSSKGLTYHLDKSTSQFPNHKLTNCWLVWFCWFSLFWPHYYNLSRGGQRDGHKLPGDVIAANRTVVGAGKALVGTVSTPYGTLCFAVQPQVFHSKDAKRNRGKSATAEVYNGSAVEYQRLYFFESFVGVSRDPKQSQQKRNKANKNHHFELVEETNLVCLKIGHTTDPQMAVLLGKECDQPSNWGLLCKFSSRPK